MSNVHVNVWYPGYRKEGSWGEGTPWEGGEGQEGEEMSHLWDEGGDDDHDDDDDDVDETMMMMMMKGKESED